MDQGFTTKATKYDEFMSFMKPFLNKTEAAAEKLKPPSGRHAPRPKRRRPDAGEGERAGAGGDAPAQPAQPQRNTFVDFFRNLGETVKDFPIDVKNQVKTEVLRVVIEAREFVLTNSAVEQLFVVEDIKQEPLEH